MPELSLKRMRNQGQGVVAETGEEANAVEADLEEDAIADPVGADPAGADPVGADLAEADLAGADPERDLDHDTGDLEVGIDTSGGQGAEIEIIRKLLVERGLRRML